MNAPHSASPVSSSLSAAVDRADRRLAAAAHDAQRIHRRIDRALQQGQGALPGAVPQRRWAGRVEPWVDRVSSTARELARQSADLASQAGHQAQASWNRYADVTGGYIARQPLRAVLIAAAAGAGLALLLAAGRSRR